MSSTTIHVSLIQTLKVEHFQYTFLDAFHMYTLDYMTKNPNLGFPPKGSWAKVPKAQVERYQAQADALKAQRT